MTKRFLVAAVSFGLIFFFIAMPERTTHREKLKNSFSLFLYQLQDISLEALLTTDVELIILDPDDDTLSPVALQTLKHSGKTLIAYLSIGEAEQYRGYWRSWDEKPPSFLMEENPLWPGNYRVRYGDPLWQEIILREVDRLIKAEYDGVALDVIDVYSSFEKRPEAREEMIDFVIAISKRAKAENPHIVIIAVNALPLIASPTYLAAIDGLLHESTWYLGSTARETDDINEDLFWLHRAQVAGKFILAIDYPKEHDAKCDFLGKAQREGFLAFVGNRELNNIKQPLCH